jgi:hypothetical protein
MTVSLATLDALKARVPGGIEQPDEARAQAALDDASALVRQAVGTTYLDEDGVTLLATVPEIVASITLQCALRGFLNPPDGLRQTNLDGYGESFERGGIYLTSDERSTLAAVPISGSRKGLTVISTTRMDDEEARYAFWAPTDHELIYGL